MIISRTPMRISFAGGGTDLNAFYSRHEGAVVSTAINKYVYVTVNRAFDHRIRASYSKTEMVDHVDDIKHNLIREAMKLTGVTEGVEITSIADIPSKGTGLGSSSSYVVGLLNALYAYRGQFQSPKNLAEGACRIEIENLGEPIGKQDQYIAAYGGLQHIRFNSDETVFVDPVICFKKTKTAFQNNLMLFYTNITRRASDILCRQSKKTGARMEALGRMKEISDEINEILRANRDISRIGRLLHENWELKKSLVPGITLDVIDAYYRKAVDAGALGGKLLGAGGGGFLLFYVEEQNRDSVRGALGDLREVYFEFEPQGSKIIYIEE